MSSKKSKFEPYENELIKLRNEGYTYEQLAEWLAVHKKEVASVAGIRNFLKQIELKILAGK